ncbi:unnamed protein product, partial [Rotaria sp. Silwood2]
HDDNQVQNFICNCTNINTFGKYCEYELFYNATTFSQTVTKQYELKRQYPYFGGQLYGNLSCYTTLLQCDYGELCLNWRDICDGIQQCIDGKDENNCDKLEFNECDNDDKGEYRCGNGACIPAEYFLDGK